MRERIYDAEKRVESCRKRVLESKLVTKRNKSKIFEFINQMRANNLSPFRQAMYLRYLRKVAEAVPKDFKQITKQDLEAVLTQEWA